MDGQSFVKQWLNVGNPRRRIFFGSRHHASGCRGHQPELPVRVRAGADPGGVAAGRGAEAGRREACAVRDWS